MIMKKTFILSLSLILVTLPALLPFFNAKFFYTQDHIFIARLQQMSTALQSGQFPVRWAPDMRFGEPLFNFYAPLPYYLGAFIKLFGFNFIWVAKILFIASSVLSAVAMYIFCRKLFSRKAAFLAATLYVYAPYRAVDIYVRGALSEAWVFVFFPLIFYASLLICQKMNLKNLLFLSFSLTGLILTHNVTTLMFLPFLLLWWVYLVLVRKNWKLILPFFGSVILGVSLSAFFVLPAIFERQFIQTKYLIVGYFDFRAHFVAVRQFFSTFWGYGASLWGPVDGMSFQIGLAHWLILISALAAGFICRKNRQLLGLLCFLGLSFVLSVFLQHNKSAYIWEAVPVMAFIQFPWRFLAISVFLAAITGGAVADCLKNRFKAVYFILLALAVFANIQYFKPKEYVDNGFFDKFLNTDSMKKGVDLTKDYLPVWVQTVDGEVFDTFRAEKDDIKVSDLRKKSTLLSAVVSVPSDSLIEAPITYFPGWEVRVDGKVVVQSLPSKMGLVRFALPAGGHRVQIEFKDTPIRSAGNLLSAASLLLAALFLKKHKFG